MTSIFEGSEILEIFKGNTDCSIVADYMHDFCSRPGGPRYSHKFIESLDFRYKVIPDPMAKEGEEGELHLFRVECEHGWLSQKRIVNMLLTLSTTPDTVIAGELEHSIGDVFSQCDACRCA